VGDENRTAHGTSRRLPRRAFNLNIIDEDSVMTAFTHRFAALSLAASACIAQAAYASSGDQALVLTASNTAANQLLIYDTAGTLLKQLPTQGQGGVGGNAGGIAQDLDHVAVVNFGSGTVSVFGKNADHSGLHFEKLVGALASPVSVAFGNSHLYILTTTHVESHAIADGVVSAAADGTASLVIADGSSAQVGALTHALVISEKSNAIETVALDVRGAVHGTTQLALNIPANVNAPFGLATRGDEAYVTIAHADEISLVRKGAVLTVTGSGTQHAPCWVTLDGPFLFSANSPSKTVSRYAVYGEHVIQDAAIVATFEGNPTDIAYRGAIAAVIDHDASNSRVSVFHVDEDGHLSLHGLATIAGTTANGVAVWSWAADSTY
jgi:hypothetical protein